MKLDQSSSNAPIRSKSPGSVLLLMMGDVERRFSSAFSIICIPPKDADGLVNDNEMTSLSSSFEGYREFKLSEGRNEFQSVKLQLAVCCAGPSSR